MKGKNNNNNHKEFKNVKMIFKKGIQLSLNKTQIEKSWVFL